MGQVRELLARVPHALPVSMRAVQIRARASLVTAAVCLVLALVFLPDFLTGLFSGERAELLAMAKGLGTWQLFFLELLLLGAAFGLGTWGIRDLRGSERAALQRTEAETGGERAEERPDEGGIAAAGDVDGEQAEVGASVAEV